MFTRIYSGIFASVVLAAVLNYGLYAFSYDNRYRVYEQNAMTGVMSLLADALAKTPTSARPRYLEIAAELLGAVTFDHGEAFFQNLSASQQLALEAGQAVNLSKQESGIRWLLPLDFQGAQPVKLVELRIRSLTEQQFRGHALLLITELSRKTGRLAPERLQRYSAYPLALVSRDTLGLDRQQRSRLRKGTAVVDYGAETEHHFSVFAYWQNGEVLRIGPIPRFEQLPAKLVLSMITVTILLIALVSYWLVHRLEQRLGQIAAMVNRFGEGQLEERVKMAGGDLIALVAEKINAMADRIQLLLKGQREIMQAVSHEFRTPLTRIRFRLQVLDDDLLEAGVTPKTDAIRGDIDQLEQLVAEVLEHHKLVHQPILEKAAFSLSKPVNEICRNLNILYPHIDMDQSNLASEPLMADPTGVTRLLQNLISNACKHARTQVRVSSVITQDCYSIRIEDDGVGIPEEERSKVFEAFYRVDSSRNQSTGGYGLGLAIVKRIVDLHGGRIELLASELGGAKFVVHFFWSKEEFSGENSDCFS
ncbi:hypothetical protein HBA55_31745 [Pseudomaricurvus alkylphenolicus]|uniref:ATP-binding protein n=1 Tax=Pseudomaricurvus alkylphenolicus TaxID=1306991 RepID=UPI00141E0D5C|nr:ATP-binding protein [Pseudomaricurvus alkylphenolicus]NIB44216.1 hypothetical protein [Pseudomaricurvus alkylphenolicus]